MSPLTYIREFRQGLFARMVIDLRHTVPDVELQWSAQPPESLRFWRRFRRWMRASLWSAARTFTADDRGRMAVYSALRSRCGENAGLIEAREWIDIAPGFFRSAEIQTDTPTNAQVAEFFANRGLDLPDGAQVVYNPRLWRLVVQSSDYDLDLVERMSNVYFEAVDAFERQRVADAGSLEPRTKAGNPLICTADLDAIREMTKPEPEE